jgi:hypothetical protein
MALSLRPLLKKSLDIVKYPDPKIIPEGVVWKGMLAPKPNFEKFYNPTIRSALCLPKTWSSYEFDQEFGKQVVAQNVISGVEDAKSLGYFQTGITFSLIQVNDARIIENIAEGLRSQLTKEIVHKFGGSTNWVENGPSTKICSIRYASSSPSSRFRPDVMPPSGEMIFIQDIILDIQSKFVFRIKIESPNFLFREHERVFELIKTSGYYVVNDAHRHGIALLEL